MQVHSFVLALKKILSGRAPWTYVYVVLIPLVNWSFANVPTYQVLGGTWNPMVIPTGLILVFRDLAQREIGHTIFLPLAIGVTISFFMASPEIAAASACAFAISETIDWAIFTVTKRPLSKRILWSCAASAPVDSAVFLFGASLTVPGVFSWVTLIGSIASKLLGAYCVYLTLKHRERKNAV